MALVSSFYVVVISSSNVILAAPETADRLKPNMSFAATAVVVKSVKVVLRIAVPDDIATPLVLIELPDVGEAVPVATFHVETVAVPASTAMFHAVMLPATGNTTYAPCWPVVGDTAEKPIM